MSCQLAYLTSYAHPADYAHARQVAVGSGKPCSSGKWRTFSILCDLMIMWDVICIQLSLGVSGLVVKRTDCCVAPAAGWLIKLETWLHADSNYNPMTYYLAVSIPLRLDWMPFLASQNSVTVIWDVCLKLHRRRARSATLWRYCRTLTEVLSKISKMCSYFNSVDKCICKWITSFCVCDFRVVSVVCLFRMEVSGVDVAVNAMKEYWGSEGIAPLVINLDTRWKWVVSFTPDGSTSIVHWLGG